METELRGVVEWWILIAKEHQGTFRHHENALDFILCIYTDVHRGKNSSNFTLKDFCVLLYMN